MIFSLRTVNADDVSKLVTIEQQSFADPSWTSVDFLKYDCIVAIAGETPIGFMVSRQVFPGAGSTPPEREILNLAVAPEFRQRGIGRALIQHELERRATLFLEVRESNLAALQLYKSEGFKQVSIRTNYYDNPIESAIVMQMKW